MAKPSQHKSHTRSRILLLGDSGAGKTGAIASLVNSDDVDRIFIVDFDDGLDSLLAFADPKKLEEKVRFETLRDEVVEVPARNGTRPAARNPKAWSEMVKLFQNWTDRETGEKFGPITELGPRDWVIIDSLTRGGDAAMNYSLKVNKRIGKPRRQKDWGDAIERELSMVQELTSEAVKCNVLITAHLKNLRVRKTDKKNADDDETDDTYTAKRYPSALGQGLPRDLGTFFNVVLMADTMGSGAATRRIIRTTPTADVDIKVPLPPKTLPSEVPLDGGLARIVKTLQRKED